MGAGDRQDCKQKQNPRWPPAAAGQLKKKKKYSNLPKSKMAAGRGRPAVALLKKVHPLLDCWTTVAGDRQDCTSPDLGLGTPHYSAKTGPVVIAFLTLCPEFDIVVSDYSLFCFNCLTTIDRVRVTDDRPCPVLVCAGN
jgi:hypothetical protein